MGTVQEGVGVGRVRGEARRSGGLYTLHLACCSRALLQQSERETGIAVGFKDAEIQSP